MVFKFNFAVGESAKAETDGEKSGSASSRECAEANLKPFSEVFPEDNSTTGTVRGEEHCVNGVKLTKVCVSTDQARSLTGIEEVACNDLLPGRYEGGFKLWEGSDDLVGVLVDEWGGPSPLSDPGAALPEAVKGKRVLELGCGHGLPGVLAAVAGAAEVHFADFNEEVLSALTSRNHEANIATLPEGRTAPSVRYFAGDWLLVCRRLCSEGLEYDIVLTSETTYSLEASQRLLKALEELIPPGSPTVVYVAAKTYYFGVGGGAQQFRKLCSDNGSFSCKVVRVFEDGTSNKREVLRLQRTPLKS